MQELFREVIRINASMDDAEKEAQARALFAKLNAMTMPESFNWADEIFEGIHVKETPDKNALVWTDLESREIRTYTYRELAGKANQMINLMHRSGVQAGNSFYLMAPAEPENWFASLACIKAGIILVPTAVSMTQRTMEFRFDSFSPDVILADENSTELIDDALEETGVVPKLKLVLGRKEGWISFDAIEKEPDTARKADTKPDDILFCFFTSGTSGLPKRVGHTSVSYPLGHLSTSLMTGIAPDDFHNNLSSPGWAKWSWSSFFAPFNVGASVSGFKFTSFNAEIYMEAVANQKVTSLCASPTAWRKFAGLNLDFFDLRHLKQAVSAGEPLHADVVEKFMQKTGIQIRDYYGQTETTAMIGNAPWHKNRVRPGSFGFPCAMYDIGIVDNEGNEIDVPDVPGHLVIKLDQNRPVGLFREYIGSPDKMHAVFVDNYYYTGDRVYFDEEGYCWFKGRADDVIKSSDFRIGPFEVESALMEHYSVSETAVIGSPDQNRYQLVKAYIVLIPGMEASRELALELFQHCTVILPKFKVPKILEFVTAVPKTISGKIRRVELRKIESDKLESAEKSKEKAAEFFYWDFPELSAK